MHSKQVLPQKKNIRSTRRWQLMGVDLLITMGSFFLSWACLSHYIQLFVGVWWIHLLMTLSVTSMFLLLFRCYDSLWRYEESREYLMQFLALTCSHSVLGIANFLIFLPDSMNSAQEYPQRMQLLVYLISLLTMWLFRVGCGYVLGVWMGFGVVGVFAAQVLDWVVRSVCFVIRYRGTKWQHGAVE